MFPLNGSKQSFVAEKVLPMRHTVPCDRLRAPLMPDGVDRDLARLERILEGFAAP